LIKTYAKRWFDFETSECNFKIEKLDGAVMIMKYFRVGNQIQFKLLDGWTALT